MDLSTEPALVPDQATEPVLVPTEPKLAKLPDIPLKNILKRLPVSKLLELSTLCTRFNDMKYESFKERTQLQILGGCEISKGLYRNGKDDCRFVLELDYDQKLGGNGDFDLVLKFENQQPMESGDDDQQIPDNPKYGDKITLQHDVLVTEPKQMASLGRLFPNVTDLTVVLAAPCTSSGLLGQLFDNWPQMNRLQFVNFDESFINLDDLLPHLNALTRLKESRLHFGTGLKNPTQLIQLLQNASELKTFYIKDCFRWKASTGGYSLGALIRVGLQLPELRETLSRLEHIILAGTTAERTQICSEEMFDKTVRMSATICNPISYWGALPYWHSLQFLYLDVIGFCSFSLTDFLRHISKNRQLTELCVRYGIDLFANMQLESIARRWPKLASVRSFVLIAEMEPHQLYRFKFAFPNATKLVLRSSIETDTRNRLCDCCQFTVQRAIDLYGEDNIENIYWIYNNVPGEHELVAKVELYTNHVGDRKYVNFGHLIQIQ